VAVVSTTLGAGTAPAEAVTVSVIPWNATTFSDEHVLIAAAPGEGNRVTAHLVEPAIPPFPWFDPASPSPTFTWTVSDAANAMSAGAGCVPVDQHTVRCTETSLSLEADLGDMDDEIALSREAPGQSYGPILQIQGGPGNDRLVAPPTGWNGGRITGDAGNDQLVNGAFGGDLDGGAGDDRLDGGTGPDHLNGGGGSDQLYGHDGDDMLNDNDRDATAETPPGPDLVDGGPGSDSVDYQDRSAPVRVDLSDANGDGELGEADRLIDIENVYGGSGDDRLAGNADPNDLYGLGGRDRLLGGRGNDRFVPMDFYIAEAAGGRVSCGADRDSLRNTNANDFLDRDCELVHYRFSRFPFAEAYPFSVNKRRLRYHVSCPQGRDAEGTEAEGPYQPDPCTATIKLTQTVGSHRTLARGKLGRGNGKNRTISALLTRAGRRLATQTGGVKARVHITTHTVSPYDFLRFTDSVEWTIQCRASR
jgi:Ca2+-binding RTX toxin-like protein